MNLVATPSLDWLLAPAWIRLRASAPIGIRPMLPASTTAFTRVGFSTAYEATTWPPSEVPTMTTWVASVSFVTASTKPPSILRYPGTEQSMPGPLAAKPCPGRSNA